ncbi:MAG: hypothetical protein ACRBBN_01135 [Methyloligellaceae bacterium]
MLVEDNGVYILVIYTLIIAGVLAVLFFIDIMTTNVAGREKIQKIGLRLLFIATGYYAALIATSQIFAIMLSLYFAQPIYQSKVVTVFILQLGTFYFLLPAVVLIIVFEFLKLKSLTAHLIATNIFSLVVFFFATVIIIRRTPFTLLTTNMSIEQTSWQTFLTITWADTILIPLAGTAAGLVYWAIAGRNAGSWRN